MNPGGSHPGLHCSPERETVTNPMTNAASPEMKDLDRHPTLS